jgi:hypothetical protein
LENEIIYPVYVPKAENVYFSHKLLAKEKFSLNDMPGHTYCGTTEVINSSVSKTLIMQHHSGFKNYRQNPK